MRALSGSLLISFIMYVAWVVFDGASGKCEHADTIICVMTITEDINISNGSPEIKALSGTISDGIHLVTSQFALSRNSYADVIKRPREYSNWMGYCLRQNGKLDSLGDGIILNTYTSPLEHRISWRLPVISDIKFNSGDCRRERSTLQKWFRNYYTDIGAQLTLLLISNNPQLAPLNRSVNENQYHCGNLNNFLLLFPTAILLASGAAMVGYGLYCCPPLLGVVVVLLASAPISAAVWCFFFGVIGF